MHTVRCRSCHRLERWEGERREVLAEGGSRRPSVHPQLAAWRTLVDAHAGRTGPVVATCAACGQPMVATTEGLPSIEWTVHTPDGPVTAKRHGLRGPAGELDWNEANALVERHYPEETALRDWVGPAAVLRAGWVGLMVVPVVVWVGAAFLVVVFLFNVWK